MAGDNIPFGADTTESVDAAKQTKVGQVNNLKNAGSTGIAGSERTSAGGDTVSPSNTTRENWGAGATPHGSVTKNPNIESLDSDADGSIEALNNPLRLNETRMGKGAFGANKNGTGEVDNNSDPAREDVGMPSNKNPEIADTSIPNVGSRFFR